MLSIDEFLHRYGLDESARADLLTLITAGEHSSSPEQETLILSQTETVDLNRNGPSSESASRQVVDERYEDLGQLGVGGMGEVRRVRDKLLNRQLAMKVIKAECSPRSLERFLDEAQTTAQLEHPGIVPVHDLGHTSKGRAYFTMKEIHGRT
ncbi:MAG: hypothetical protein HN348_23615, partial [Proteobacteria bacterium]|nr:hypothetical protein [Pseudomonadota bacterium]